MKIQCSLSPWQYFLNLNTKGLLLFFIFHLILVSNWGLWSMWSQWPVLWDTSVLCECVYVCLSAWSTTTNIYSFTLRGKGPLKHTTDVIYAAKMISESGSRMDVLARQIANQVSSLQTDMVKVHSSCSLPCIGFVLPWISFP